MSLEIRQITSDAELLAVGALRYQVTVQEMQLTMRHADHHKRTVIEPLDHVGHVLGAWDNGTLVGSLRLSFLKEADVGDYFTAYGVSQVPAQSVDFVSMTTRLVIAHNYRRGRVSLLLPISAYLLALDNGITHDLIDSRPALVPFFSKLGYRTHLQSWSHPEFGNVIVQYLALEDDNHLAAVGSPFRDHLINRKRLNPEPSQKIGQA